MEIANVNVGKPDIKQDAPSHSPGVKEGNSRGHITKEPGIKTLGRFMALATVRRSTGVNPKGRQVIDPRMPLLTPP